MKIHVEIEDGEDLKVNMRHALAYVKQMTMQALDDMEAEPTARFQDWYESIELYVLDRAIGEAHRKDDSLSFTPQFVVYDDGELIEYFRRNDTDTAWVRWT